METQLRPVVSKSGTNRSGNETYITIFKYHKILAIHYYKKNGMLRID